MTEIRTFAIVVALGFWPVISEAQCTKDIECRGDRICEGGKCVYPPSRSTDAKPKPSAAAAPDLAPSLKAIEQALACTSKPSPGKVVLELQRNEMIERKASANIDSINYFRVTKPFEVWGLKVTHVIGFDHDRKIFFRGPGTAPPITLGVVVPYPVQQVTQKLSSAGVSRAEVRPSDLQTAPASKAKQVLTEVACEGGF